MTLKEISQRIQNSQKLAANDPSTALRLNRELFIDIVRQDLAYLVPEAEVSAEALEQKLFRPYIAPAQENDPRLFLRIFSHQDVSEAFAERLGRNQICMVDGVELIQLAKTYFLRGVYGFLLNDGIAWTALSFPDFLMDCFQEILGDSNLARPEYISLIQFINMVRQNKYYHIQAGHQDVLDVNHPMQIRFMDQPQSIWTNAVGEWVYEDCAVNHLIYASGLDADTIIHIKTAKIELRIAPSQLRAALCAAGLSERGAQFDLDFHTDSIALDYRLEDFDLERLPCQVQLAELPRLDTRDTKNEADSNRNLEKGRGGKSISSLLAKLGSLFRRRCTGNDDNQYDEDILDITVLDDREELSSYTDREKEWKKRKPFKISPKTMISLFFLIAFLIIAAAIFTQVFKPVPKDKIEKAMKDGEHVQVIELYSKSVVANPDCQEELSQLISAYLDESIAAYAADDITANQLAEIITAYERIPALTNKCDAVYVRASALEQSKIIYQQGLVETAMSKRLEIWRGVIEADTGSQALIKRSLEENSEMYKTFVFSEVDQMERGEALRCLNILQSYYPNDNEITKKMAERLDTLPDPATNNSVGNGAGHSTGEYDWPVFVRDISVDNSEGPYDLYIKWGNVSGQTIERVLFHITPLCASGEAAGGSYTADTGGPYEDGYEMPDTFFWPSAWEGLEHEIVALRLDSIQVWYSNAAAENFEGWSMHEPVIYGELPELSNSDPKKPAAGSSLDFLGGIL